jgi:hypothetical protein
MRDLTNTGWIKAKAALFLIAGTLASALLLVEHPTLKVALLLVIAIWCFCRAYYFAFYVIERYIDPGYKFSGLISFVRYLAGKGRMRRGVS